MIARLSVVLMIILGVILSPRLVFALGEVKFGPEFTFYNPITGDTFGDGKVEMIMREHLIANQPEGAKFVLSGVRFNSPNGWWFQTVTDGKVLEVKMSPASVETFRQYKDDIQDAIFVSFANAGFIPALFMGGGHINLGMDAFSGNPLLLRNFIVDLFNHNELFTGIFSYDTHNAVPFNLLNDQTQENIKGIVGEFDYGVFQGDHGMVQFVSRIQREMKERTDASYNAWGNEGTRGKVFAVNFGHVDMGTESRIEIRAVRPQANMDVWVRQIDLIYHRLLYLEKLKTPLAWDLKTPLLALDFREAKHHLNPPVRSKDALRSFYDYVTESGLSWWDHRDYMWPAWISNGDRDAFENSEWFKEREARKCGQSLSA